MLSTKLKGLKKMNKAYNRLYGSLSMFLTGKEMDDFIECPSCGGEMINRLVGDECFLICADCQYFEP